MDTASPFADDPFDFSEIVARVRRRWLRTIGLGLIGLSVATVGFLLVNPLTATSTSARVSFSFPGFEKGQNPDGSKFQPEDIRAPEVIANALKNLQLDSSESFQATIRSALTVEGIISPSVVAERDRLRAAGQNVPPYLPDEYRLTLSLSRHFPLSSRQRELLLNEIVNVFRDRFDKTYSDLPANFGNAFETLKNADYFDYEPILSDELENMYEFLDQMKASARTFRSPRTNFSFSDLKAQAQLFGSLRLNEALGIIRKNGLSRDRRFALTTIDYRLHNLEAQADKASSEAKVIQDLIATTQERSQGYVMAVKNQAAQAQGTPPVLDQTVIDSLLANDAYGFLVRQGLTAGFKLKAIEAEKAVWLERKKALEGALGTESAADDAANFKAVDKSMEDLRQAYVQLVDNIHRTNEDYAHQQFADAARISMQPATASVYRELAIVAAIGGIAGLLAGIGLSLQEKSAPRP